MEFLPQDRVEALVTLQQFGRSYVLVQPLVTFDGRCMFLHGSDKLRLSLWIGGSRWVLTEQRLLEDFRSDAFRMISSRAFATIPCQRKLKLDPTASTRSKSTVVSNRDRQVPKE